MYLFSEQIQEFCNVILLFERCALNRIRRKFTVHFYRGFKTVIPHCMIKFFKLQKWKTQMIALSVYRGMTIWEYYLLARPSHLMRKPWRKMNLQVESRPLSGVVNRRGESVILLFCYSESDFPCSRTKQASEKRGMIPSLNLSWPWDHFIGSSVW